MKIIVVGGSTPGKFGNDFVVRARNEGHTVWIIAHSDKFVDNNTVVADFKSTESVINAYKHIVAIEGKIDILLYNSNSRCSYPYTKDHFKIAPVDENEYMQALRIHSIIPHSLALEFLHTSSDVGRMIFMSSRSALMLTRNEEPEGLGYAGGKAYQTRLMISMARIHDPGPIFTAIAPTFDYEIDHINEYKEIFPTVYNHIMTLDKQYHGKIVGIWSSGNISPIN